MVLFSVPGLVEAVGVLWFYFHVQWFYFQYLDSLKQSVLNLYYFHAEWLYFQYLDSLKQFVLNGFILTWNGFIFSTWTR